MITLNIIIISFPFTEKAHDHIDCYMHFIKVIKSVIVETVLIKQQASYIYKAM